MTKGTEFSAQYPGLPDIQETRDTRGIDIDRVGVTNVRHPIAVPLRAGGTINTVASLSATVSLAREKKGTHMSRLMIAINNQSHRFRPDMLDDVLQEMLILLDAREVMVEMEFPIFLTRAAPVTGIDGVLDYNCQYSAMVSVDGRRDKLVGVRASVTSCCPCSKEISQYGAHNQRSEVGIAVAPSRGAFIWFEDLIDIAERSASSQLYPVLKRADEKHVTEAAYDDPKFVEDIVRDSANELLRRQEADDISWFRVSVTNYESIHNHDAFAQVERGTRGALLVHPEARGRMTVER
jgi:GTP cyclohydrolase I